MIIFQNTSYGKIELDCENKIIVTPLNIQPNAVDGIRLVVVKVSNCENSNVLELFGEEEKLYETLIYDNIILENTIKTISLPYDGTYFLRIRDYYSGSDNKIQNEETVSFTTYNTFILSILDKTKQLFCGCNSCNLLNLFKENNTKELELLTNYNILFSLLNQNNNLTCLNCEFEELIKCDYINENFKNKNKFNVFKSNLLIANLFNNLSLYLQNQNNNCFEKIINQIKLCLKKNNITIKNCN